MDVLIVGGGPIGIELGIALARAGVSLSVLEAAQVGATIQWYAPQTHFFSSPERIAIAGVPLQTLDQTKATREEYLTYLRTVVQQFDVPVETGIRVKAVVRRGEGFDVTVEGRMGTETRRAGRVVLAIGDMHHPHRIGVPGEDLPHVSHYFADPHAYFRRRVVVVGGRNSAVEAAIRCVRVGASEVTLSIRGNELDAGHIKFWLFPEIRGMIREGRIAFLPATTVQSIDREAVVFGPEGRRVVADDVLLLTGYVQDTSLFEQAGVGMIGPERKPRFDPETMETNVPGLYVAGTAAAGTQVSGTREFIETSHVHVTRIVAALTGRSMVPARPAYEMPES